MAIAKVEIICKECGERFTHRAERSNRTKANEYEEWATQNINTCPECYKQARQATEEARIDKLLEGHNLPDLIGSEKQVAWAVTLRRKMVAKYVKFIKMYDTEPDPLFWEKVKMANTAKFWIDNRFLSEEEFGWALMKVQ